METLYQQYLPSYTEEMGFLSRELIAINAEIESRGYQSMSPWTLAVRQHMILQRMDKLRLQAAQLITPQKPKP
jgi:hypothetical protein